jgi:hypothetical protein
MERKLKISKELAAELITMPNIKNQPLKEGDVVTIGTYMQNAYAAKGKDKPYVDHYYTARVAGNSSERSVKIPVAELLKMTGATTTDDEGNFDVAPVFAIVESRPRTNQNGVMFPLTQYRGYSDFLKKVQAGSAKFTQESVEELRKSGLLCDADDTSKAIQDYVVDPQG